MNVLRKLFIDNPKQENENKLKNHKEPPKKPLPNLPYSLPSSINLEKKEGSLNKDITLSTAHQAKEKTDTIVASNFPHIITLEKEFEKINDLLNLIPKSGNIELNSINLSNKINNIIDFVYSYDRFPLSETSFLKLISQINSWLSPYKSSEYLIQSISHLASELILIQYISNKSHFTEDTKSILRNIVTILDERNKKKMIHVTSFNFLINSILTQSSTLKEADFIFNFELNNDKKLKIDNFNNKFISSNKNYLDRFLIIRILINGIISYGKNNFSPAADNLEVTAKLINILTIAYNESNIESLLKCYIFLKLGSGKNYITNNSIKALVEEKFIELKNSL